MTNEEGYLLSRQPGAHVLPTPTQAFTVALPPPGTRLLVPPRDPAALLSAQILCNRLAAQQGMPLRPQLRLKLEAAAARLTGEAPPDPARFPGVALESGEVDLFLENLRVGAELLAA